MFAFRLWSGHPRALRSPYFINSYLPDADVCKRFECRVYLGPVDATSSYSLIASRSGVTSIGRDASAAHSWSDAV